MKRLRHLSILLIIAVVPTIASAQWHGAVVPDSLSFQGAVDSAGIPLNKTVPMTFKLYKNGSEVWTEAQSSVEVVDGVFNVVLGSVTPLDTVAFSEAIELGVAVGTDGEMTPRTPLAASAFALGMRGMHAVWVTLGSSHESFNIIGGAPNNGMTSNVIGGTIGGGGGKEGGNPRPNSVEANWGTIGGGGENTTSGNFATIGGGIQNTAGDFSATVGGGTENTAGGFAATVAGGSQNAASGNYAAVGGGSGNTAGADGAVVGGGNINSAEGRYSTVAGGYSNRASGGYSFAGGQQAKADHGGTFVWADSSLTGGEDFVSTGINQFLIRAGGGVGINTNAPSNPLEVGTDGTNGNGAHVTAGGTWTDGSSRTFKEDLRTVDAGDILRAVVDLPLYRWRYRDSDEGDHMGPVAEDFFDAFGLGNDERYIAGVDGDGVAMAAIQGLYQLVVAQQAEIDELKKRLERNGE